MYRQRPSLIVVFVLGMIASTLGRVVLLTIPTANADDGHVEALREIARAIEAKECK